MRRPLPALVAGSCLRSARAAGGTQGLVSIRPRGRERLLLPQRRRVQSRRNLQDCDLRRRCSPVFRDCTPPMTSHGNSIRLSRMALTTATVRLVVPSLRIAFLTWKSTVFSLIVRIMPISHDDFPRAVHIGHSFSRRPWRAPAELTLQTRSLLCDAAHTTRVCFPTKIVIGGFHGLRRHRPRALRRVTALSFFLAFDSRVLIDFRLKKVQPLVVSVHR